MPDEKEDPIVEHLRMRVGVKVARPSSKKLYTFLAVAVIVVAILYVIS